MKKWICFLIAAFMLAGCGTSVAEEEAAANLTRPPQSTVYGVEAPSATADITFRDGQPLLSGEEKMTAREESEMRAVWLAYVNYRDVIKGNTQAQFTANMDRVFQNAAGAGFNTVFVQVRPFGDALYPSDYFPWSRFLTGTEGQDPGYDPLAIWCSLAEKHGLRIEAWINPYRVRTDKRELSPDNQALKWLNAGSPAALQWGDGIYYNPASEQARSLIIKGVEEIVRSYDVDGIHFDDYFYPTTDMQFDAEIYQASGSRLTQADWRRENVNILVRDVYSAIKKIDPGCVFGISPQGNMGNNYDGQFIDCAEWLANPGYVDYICPQIYYGFENGTNPYAQTVSKWADLIKADGVKLYVGIAAYKLGAADQWAGAGQNEWIGTSNLLAQMVRTAREADHYGGVAIYNYDSIFAGGTSQVKTELENLKKAFQEA